MTCKPIIGINTDFRQAERNKPAFSYLAAGYFRSITAAGGIPVIIPPIDDRDSICTILEHLQGFLMIGGRGLGSSQ